MTHCMPELTLPQYFTLTTNCTRPAGLILAHNLITTTKDCRKFDRYICIYIGRSVELKSSEVCF